MGMADDFKKPGSVPIFADEGYANQNSRLHFMAMFEHEPTQILEDAEFLPTDDVDSKRLETEGVRYRRVTVRGASVAPPPPPKNGMVRALSRFVRRLGWKHD